MSQPSIDLIRAERYRQIQSENHTPEDDVGRVYELIELAVGYAYNFSASDDERDLVRAGALIVAALDALRSSK